MTEDNHPSAWYGTKPDISHLHASALFSFDPRALEYHSILFAQSGSGKSFLVGRYIEEVVLSTSARVVVIDPNSDYVNIRQVNSNLYASAEYSIHTGGGYLPTEPLSEVESVWQTLEVTSLHENISVPLNRLDPFILLSAIPGDSILEIQCAFQCMKLVIEYLEVNWPTVRIKLEAEEDRLTTPFLAKALSLLAKESDLRSVELSTIFGSHAETLQVRRWTASGEAAGPDPEAVSIRTRNDAISRAFKSRLPLLQPEILRKLHYMIDTNEQYFTPKSSDSSIFDHGQVFLIDKPSLPEDLQFTLLVYWLQELWTLHESAYRTGHILKPTIIVIDEAHNLIPKETNGYPHLNATREILRKIAAEGRKYGLFLFLISQRPDKLDPLAISECQNKLIMRIGSLSALQAAAPVLGLTEFQVGVLTEATRFKKGRAFVIGPMAEASLLANVSPGITKFYVAGRRTKEGGGGKLSNTWLERGLTSMVDHGVKVNE